MRRPSLSILSAVAALGLAADPVTALAAHGKPGLWQITTKMDLGGMPQIPPAQMARMRAMGVRIPTGNTFTVTHCMTAQEVAMDKPPPMGRPGRGQECKMQNLKTDGRNVSADMVCSGKDMKGGGHFALTYDSPEHYAGKMTMSAEARGHHVATSTSFEAKWISASCAGH